MNDVNMFLSGVIGKALVNRQVLLSRTCSDGQPKVVADRVSVQDIMTTFTSLYMEVIQSVSQDVKKTERLQKILPSRVQDQKILVAALKVLLHRAGRYNHFRHSHRADRHSQTLSGHTGQVWELFLVWFHHMRGSVWLDTCCTRMQGMISTLIC